MELKKYLEDLFTESIFDVLERVGTNYIGISFLKGEYIYFKKRRVPHTKDYFKVTYKTEDHGVIFVEDKFCLLKRDFKEKSRYFAKLYIRKIKESD